MNSNDNYKLMTRRGKKMLGRYSLHTNLNTEICNTEDLLRIQNESQNTQALLPIAKFEAFFIYLFTMIAREESQRNIPKFQLNALFETNKNQFKNYNLPIDINDNKINIFHMGFSTKNILQTIEPFIIKVLLCICVCVCIYCDII